MINLLNNQGQGIIESSLPNLDTISDEPFTIKEDVYLGEALDEGRTTTREPRQRRDVRRARRRRPRRDPSLRRSPRVRGEYVAPIEEEEETEPEYFKPKTFEEFAAEKEKGEKELDFMGWKQNSLMNKTLTGKISKVAWSWYNQNYADEEEQINVALSDPAELGVTKAKGREIAIGIIDKSLEEMGSVKLTNYSGVRKAKALWDKRHELRYADMLDKKRQEADMPSLGDIAKAVAENPGDLAYEMAQELINKPELVLAPQFAAARAMSVTANAAKAVGMGVRATQVSTLAAGTAGAYAGGVTLGTIDRVLSQDGGDVDYIRAMEQSQIDGVLGMVMFGAGRVLTRGTSTNKKFNENSKEVAAFAEEMKSTTELNLTEARSRSSKIRDKIEDPTTEAYVDDYGRVVIMEVRETLQSDRIKADIEDLKVLEKDYANYAHTLKIVKESIADKEVKLKEAIDKEYGEVKIKEINDEITELKKKDTPEELEDLAKAWASRTKKSPTITNNFLQFKDVNGNKHTLRRVTPDLLQEGMIHVEGVSAIDLTGKFKKTEADSTFAHLWKNYVVSATSPLEKVAKQSATAKLLLDTVNPKDSNGVVGRAPVYTIQENTNLKTAEFGSRFSDVLKIVADINRGDVALRKHLRGVEKSTDPRVIAAGDMVRKLLDDVRDYSVSAGVKIDDAKDFLPRYYNKAKLKDPEVRNKMLERIATVVKEDGTPKYDLKKVKRSIDDIANNTYKTSDEGSRFKASKEIMPVGYRKWNDIPDSILDDFLEEDLMGNITRYINNAVKRTEVDRVFGYNGGKLDKMIEAISRESEAAGRLLTDQETVAINDIYRLLNGSYGGTAHAKPAADAAIATQSVLKLPLVTATSILEPTSVLFKLKEGGKMKALFNAYGGRKARKLFGDKSVEEIRKEAKEMGLIHNVSIQEKLEAMMGEGLEGWPAKINNKFMRVTMLHQFTEHTRTVAYEAARNDIIKAGKGLLVNPTNKKAAGRRDFLSRMNIHPDELTKWVEDGASVTSPTYMKVKRGAARFANEMVANPNKINKSKALSSNSSLVRVMAQFKSFSSVFTNDVMGSTYDDAARSWNRGDRLSAVRTLGAAFAAVSAMTFWTTYDSSIMFEEGVIGDDTEGEVLHKMTTGVLGMVVPGAAMIAPLYSGRGTSALLGPTASDLDTLGKEFNRLTTEGKIDAKGAIKRIAPSYTKAAEQVAEVF